MIPGKTYTPQDVLGAAWRRRVWIGVSFVVLAAAALAWTLSLPLRYESMATIQVLTESASDTYVRTPSPTQAADRMSSLGQSTLTRSRLEAIIKDLNLYPQMRQATVMENVIKQMRDDITFNTTDRDLFVLGFAAQDPRVAHTVALRLTSIFLAENARDRGQRADAATDFLGSQLAEVRAKLDEQERRVTAYKEQYAGELPSQLAFNMQDVNSSQVTLRTLIEAIGRDQDQRLVLESEQRTLQGSDGAELTGRVASGAAGGAVTVEDQLEIARAELKALELRLTPEHPEVQRARRTVVQLESQQASGAGTSVAQAPTAASRRRDVRLREIDGQLALIDRRLAANQAEVGRVRARIAAYSRRIDQTPVREAEFATLTRDYEDTKKLYSSLMARQQDATMAADLVRKDLGDRFRVIEPAQLPERPAGQGRRVYLMIALLIAAAISLGVGALVEYRDSSLRSEEDVMVSLRLPVLAAIPNLRTTGMRGSR